MPESILVSELERRMQIAKDIKKSFHYDKCQGFWSWTDNDEFHNIGPFPTFLEALNDAVGPYLE